jgi:putative aldouronate transport system substrate-binding protein
MQGNTIKYADSIRNSQDGIYKTMQLRYGCGTAITQMIWVNSREMTKYAPDYAEINRQVAGMKDAIQPIPPSPKFDDTASEKAATLIGPLFDAFVVWDNAFLTGAKSLDRDWNAYIAEMTAKGINEYLALYNANR